MQPVINLSHIVVFMLASGILLSLITIILIQHHYRKMKTLFDIPTQDEESPLDKSIFEEEIEEEKELENKEEDEPLRGDSVFGMASDTNRSPEDNQDACCAKAIPESHIHVVAIADGIGSSQYAKEGSSFVVETAVDLVSKSLAGKNEVPDFQSIFSEIQSRLKEMIVARYPTELPTLPENSFGTTLIVGVDFPDKFVAAYVGNGAIYHMSGFFTEFPKSICIPWNVVNVLNPHTIPRDGRETLYKFFCYGARPCQYSPSVIQIGKEQRTPGDIFLITTDGIDSADQVIPVIDKQRNVYKPTNRLMDELYVYLKKFLKETELLSDENLQTMLQHFLFEMKEDEMLDDDSTLGVFISTKAVEHFHK